MLGQQLIFLHLGIGHRFQLVCCGIPHAAFSWVDFHYRQDVAFFVESGHLHLARVEVEGATLGVLFSIQQEAGTQHFHIHVIAMEHERQVLIFGDIEISDTFEVDGTVRLGKVLGIAERTFAIEVDRSVVGKDK